jgi:amidase
MSNPFAEYETFDALEIAEFIQRKVISPQEALEAAITRVEEWNPQLNAVIHKMYDQAKQTIQNGTPAGPFGGVPFLLKDLAAEYAGAPYSMGSVFAKDFVSFQNTEIVNRFIQSGLVILGKTNTPEFGLSPVTEPKLFGPTHNPWNLKYASGGSSGGSAAAVAARIVPMAHGGDGGGSIRIPAAYCGVFGFKPSRGRTPSGPQFLRLWQGMVTHHVLTRSVRDSAAMLDVLAEPELGAVFTLPQTTVSYLKAIEHPAKKLRIAMIEDPFFPSTINAEYITALKKAGQLCSDLGHTVEIQKITMPEDVSLAFLVIIAGELAFGMSTLTKIIGHSPTLGELEPTTDMIQRAGKNFNAADFAWAIQLLDQIGFKLAEFFQQYDVIMTPVLAGPPPLVGEFKPSTNETAMLEILRWIPNRQLLKRLVGSVAERFFAFAPYTPLFNIGGNPAMSVPLYKDQHSLPIGIQFAAKVGDDALLLKLARQLELAEPWIHKTVHNVVPTKLKNLI